MNVNNLLIKKYALQVHFNKSVLYLRFRYFIDAVKISLRFVAVTFKQTMIRFSGTVISGRNDNVRMVNL